MNHPYRCLVAALGLLAVAPAWALRPVQVYEVTVRGASAATVVAEGMRQALVRATGRRDAPSNPQLAALVQNSAQYLKGSRALAGGAIQLDFDAAALGTGSMATRVKGRLLSQRVPPGDALRVQLEQSAEARGLPISLVPLAVTDAAGVTQPDAAVLQSAQTLGGDAVLIGRADPANPGQWQWHLVSGYSSNAWSGATDAGIDGAADLLASVAVQSGSRPLEQVVVQVNGVATLSDYARVEQLLRTVPGVQSSGLAAAQGTTAFFNVGVRGGGTALAQGLAGSGHLGAAIAGETQLQLTYMP